MGTMGQAAAAMAPFSYARILLAEDLLINQELTRRTLEAIGHQVDVVADGAAALAAVQDGDYDLVLMDVQMPVMDGITATRRIRTLDGPARRVPIIALTSCRNRDEVSEFGPSGMDGYLTKPYSDAELYSLVELWHSEGVQRNRSAPRPPAPPTLDRVAYDHIAQVLGPARMRALLIMLREVLARPIALEAADGSTRAEASFALHGLVSQAGQIGFRELSDAARELETASAEGRATEALADRLTCALAAARTEVVDLIDILGAHAMSNPAAMRA